MLKLKSLIQESSLSRIWQHIENDKTFGIMSAWQGDRGSAGDAENKADTAKLHNEIRSLKYGLISLRGGWEYEGETFYEPSFFIPNITEKDIMRLGTKYNQYTIIFKDSKKFQEISTKDVPEHGIKIGDVRKTFAHSSGKDNLIVNDEMLKQAFSALVKGSHANRKLGFKDAEPKKFFLQEREGLSWFRMLYIDEIPLYYSEIYSEVNS